MKNIYKVTGGAIGAILIGAVGSGLWQYVFDPALSSSTRAILNLATLGMESFKNDLYMEISKGLHERASLDLSIQFNSVYGLMMILLPIAMMLKLKEIERKRGEMLEELDHIEAGTERKTRSIGELKEAVKNTKTRRFLIALYILIALAIITYTAQFVSSKRQLYINGAITYYGQSKRIISPFVSDVELRKLDSAFSQIRGPSDFQTILGDLKTIAKTNKVNLPEFEVW
jgi:hypothetical protein